MINQLSVYVLRDIKANAVCFIFPANTDDLAKRQVSALLRNDSSIYSDYPSDFELLRCGFISEIGLVTGLDSPIQVCTLDSLTI